MDNSRMESDCCGCQNNSETKPTETPRSFLTENWKPAVSLLMLLSGLAWDYLFNAAWFSDPFRLIFYGLAYMPVGLPVLKQSWLQLKKGEVFNEFFLMGIATIGAFLIGEYPEGVAVMLFYSIGEVFQENAVKRARNNVKALLDVRPETAHLLKENNIKDVHPKSIQVDDIIQVRPGERVPLDGILQNTRAAFDTSAITGESKPRHFDTGQKVLAGMINLNHLIELKVSNTYENSSISRILELVQNASQRKAKTELFIRSFAKVYTPIVVLLAALLVLVPAFFVGNYVFEDWFYRGLVFLVISCPCALVISIPLGYFGGIGAASRNGILVKGSNFLDALRSVETVVFDKTGTLTKGNFTVQKIQSLNNIDKDELMKIVYAVERSSSHPIAKAILDYGGDHIKNLPAVADQSEIPGRGIRADIDGKTVLIGSKLLLENYQIAVNGFSADHTGTIVYVAIDGKLEGSILISDELKEDSVDAVRELRKLGINRTIMLSGDRADIAEKMGQRLGIQQVYAGLLPEEKAEKLSELKKQFPGTIAYAGDGINDAPVLALSDVGIAMGALGSDVAVETADVVIQTDHPSKIPVAVKIGKATRNIVWQNIGLALGVKLLVLTLGAFGIATLWEAVFADVGVAMLAILNAVRIQNMNF